MKPFASLLAFTALLTALPVLADYNDAHNVAEGYVDSNALTTSGTVQGTGYQVDGLTATGSEFIFGAGYPSSGGTDPSTGPTSGLPVDYFFTDVFFNTSDTVDSINLYSALWSDGGWFGSGSTITAPTFQYTTDGTNWITVGTTNNNYVSTVGAATPSTANGFAPFGTAAYQPATSVESTFILDTPITGASALRLVGTGGGSDAFISGYEMQVMVAPEPSTYAMIFGGMCMLALAARLRRNLSV